MSLWGNLKRYITGYDELPEAAVGLNGQLTTPNRYKAQMEAQAQGLPANVVNGMAQGLNSGSTDADNLMKKYNAYEQPQVVHHNGLADGILGTPKKSVVAYDDKGQPLYSETERQGGLINDFAEGFRDNFNNRLSSGNLADNTMADGRQKNLINRIGEGFGTVGRILESPAGRSLLVGGLVGATGGSGLQALGYGLGTGMLNQQNRMKDRVYRKQLEDLGMSKDEINSIKGYVNDSVYKNVADSYRSRWNKLSWADLATVSPVVAEAIKTNPQLANSYIPASVARELMRGDYTEAQIMKLLAQTANLNKETSLMGKPKPPSVIVHKTEKGIDDNDPLGIR